MKKPTKQQRQAKTRAMLLAKQKEIKSLLEKQSNSESSEKLTPREKIRAILLSRKKKRLALLEEANKQRQLSLFD